VFVVLSVVVLLSLSVSGVSVTSTHRDKDGMSTTWRPVVLLHGLLAVCMYVCVCLCVVSQCVWMCVCMCSYCFKIQDLRLMRNLNKTK